MHLIREVETCSVGKTVDMPCLAFITLAETEHLHGCRRLLSVDSARLIDKASCHLHVTCFWFHNYLIFSSLGVVKIADRNETR